MLGMITSLQGKGVDMTTDDETKRNKEIVCAAKNHETQTGFCDLVKSPLSKGVNSAYGIGFIEGCVWADAHPSNELLDNICVWLKENLNRYEYYGSIDEEALLDDFLRDFSK